MLFIHNYNIIDNILLTYFLYDLHIPQKCVQLLTELGVMRLIDWKYCCFIKTCWETYKKIMLQLNKTFWEKYLSKMKT